VTRVIDAEIDWRMLASRLFSRSFSSGFKQIFSAFELLMASETSFAPIKFDWVIRFALKESSALLRWAALNTLGILGDRSPIPAIQACLSDMEIVPDLPEVTTVASAAENALKNLKACTECAS
jgi:HEAT repeat protein